MPDHLEPKAGWFDKDRPLKTLLNAGIRLRAKIHGNEAVAAELKELFDRFANAGATFAATKILTDALSETEH